MTVRSHKAVPVVTTSGATTWTVCDAGGLPVDAVDDYLHWLRSRGLSINTVKSYARYLAAVFTFLEHRGVSWDEVDFGTLTDFVVCFRAGVYPLEQRRAGGPRADATVRGAASVIREFYEHHRVENGRGPTDLRLTRSVTRGPRASHHHFMAHIDKRRSSSQQNRLASGVGEVRRPPQVINFEDDFARVLDACISHRDRALMSAFFDMGLRVGAVAGLRTGDLDIRKRSVTVTRRNDNPNGALSKRSGSFEVEEGITRFFDFYRDYLLEEVLPSGIESDFVFVNLRTPVGQPLRYGNIYKQCLAIGRRAGLDIDLTPHVLRHTHATALAKAGWTNAEIAARLGQTSASSADVYIHLANDDLAKRMRETRHLIWPSATQEG